MRLPSASSWAMRGDGGQDVFAAGDGVVVAIVAGVERRHQVGVCGRPRGRSSRRPHAANGLSMSSSVRTPPLIRISSSGRSCFSRYNKSYFSGGISGFPWATGLSGMALGVR